MLLAVNWPMIAAVGVVKVFKKKRKLKKWRPQARVGQIWKRDEDNYWSIREDLGGGELKIIGINDNHLGDGFVRRQSDFNERYTLMVDCIGCNTSRIRYDGHTHLAQDLKCWSCCD